MPNSFLPPTKNEVDGLIILGDAYNMRHPLTGGGMTVAFNDVVLLTELLKNVSDFKDINLIKQTMKRFHSERKPLSSVINILAQSLYSLFSAGSGNFCF